MQVEDIFKFAGILAEKLLSRMAFNFDDFSINSNANAMVLWLVQIIKRDSSVIDAVNMPPGNLASRKTKKDKWSIEPYIEKEE